MPISMSIFILDNMIMNMDTDANMDMNTDMETAMDIEIFKIQNFNIGYWFGLILG
jgi:hypothetical protein